MSAAAPWARTSRDPRLRRRPDIRGDTPRGEDATASDTAQHIALGREIVGNWWALLRSDAIDQLVKQAVEHNRRLVASKATLAQAQELALARFDMQF